MNGKHLLEADDQRHTYDEEQQWRIQRLAAALKAAPAAPPLGGLNIRLFLSVYREWHAQARTALEEAGMES